MKNEPRRVVAHFVFVDLRATNLEFVVTPPEADSSPKLKAATVGEFVRRNGLQLGMNANFFDPFHSKSPWDYYPHAGDPVQVLGIAASKGVIYSTQVWAGATAFLSRTNRVQLGGNVDQIWNAVSGDQWLVRDGFVVGKDDRFGAYARTALGLDASGKRLMMAIIDGKQPGFSDGLTIAEFAELLREEGASAAINLDGGGSVTLVVERNGKNGRDGKNGIVTLNSPIHTRIPGRPRPVANHLGIRVR